MDRDKEILRIIEDQVSLYVGVLKDDYDFYVSVASDLAGNLHNLEKPYELTKRIFHFGEAPSGQLVVKYDSGECPYRKIGKVLSRKYKSVLKDRLGRTGKNGRAYFRLYVDNSGKCVWQEGAGRVRPLGRRESELLRLYHQLIAEELKHNTYLRRAFGI